MHLIITGTHPDLNRMNHGKSVNLIHVDFGKYMDQNCNIVFRVIPISKEGEVEC